MYVCKITNKRLGLAILMAIVLLTLSVGLGSYEMDAFFVSVDRVVCGLPD